MLSTKVCRAATLAAVLLTAGTWPSFALDISDPALLEVAQANTPPGAIPGAPMDQFDSTDAGALVLRIDRLENELRRANGQIEQLQNQTQRLQEQLKRYQEDVEFRFGGAKPNAPTAAAPLDASPNIKPLRKSDAFDPAVNQNAVGAPRPIGEAAPSSPLVRPSPTVTAPLNIGRSAAPPAIAPGPATNSGVGFVDGPREQYKQAADAYRQGQYELAETQAKSFLAGNPNDRLAPDAIFLLGETYFQRSRPREAAEQYLRLSKDFSKSSRAPEGLMRLGQSLAALGNVEQACATFGEFSRRYPTAASSVRKSVEREMQKNHC